MRNLLMFLVISFLLAWPTSGAASGYTSYLNEKLPSWSTTHRELSYGSTTSDQGNVNSNDKVLPADVNVLSGLGLKELFVGDIRFTELEKSDTGILDSWRAERYRNRDGSKNSFHKLYAENKMNKKRSKRELKKQTKSISENIETYEKDSKWIPRTTPQQQQDSFNGHNTGIEFKTQSSSGKGKQTSSGSGLSHTGPSRQFLDRLKELDKFRSNKLSKNESNTSSKTHPTNRNQNHDGRFNSQFKKNLMKVTLIPNTHKTTSNKRLSDFRSQTPPTIASNHKRTVTPSHFQWPRITPKWTPRLKNQRHENQGNTRNINTYANNGFDVRNEGGLTHRRKNVDGRHQASKDTNAPSQEVPRTVRFGDNNQLTFKVQSDPEDSAQFQSSQRGSSLNSAQRNSNRGSFFQKPLREANFGESLNPIQHEKGIIQARREKNDMMSSNIWPHNKRKTPPLSTYFTEANIRGTPDPVPPKPVAETSALRFPPKSSFSNSLPHQHNRIQTHPNHDERGRSSSVSGTGSKVSTSNDFESLFGRNPVTELLVNTSVVSSLLVPLPLEKLEPEIIFYPPLTGLQGFDTIGSNLELFSPGSGNNKFQPNFNSAHKLHTSNPNPAEGNSNTRRPLLTTLIPPELTTNDAESQNSFDNIILKTKSNGSRHQSDNIDVPDVNIRQGFSSTNGNLGYVLNEPKSQFNPFDKPNTNQKGLTKAFSNSNEHSSSDTPASYRSISSFENFWNTPWTSKSDSSNKGDSQRSSANTGLNKELLQNDTLVTPIINQFYHLLKKPAITFVNDDSDIEDDTHKLSREHINLPETNMTSEPRSVIDVSPHLKNKQDRNSLFRNRPPIFKNVPVFIKREEDSVKFNSNVTQDEKNHTPQRIDSSFNNKYKHSTYKITYRFPPSRNKRKPLGMQYMKYNPILGNKNTPNFTYVYKPQPVPIYMRNPDGKALAGIPDIIDEYVNRTDGLFIRIPKADEGGVLLKSRRVRPLEIEANRPVRYENVMAIVNPDTNVVVSLKLDNSLAELFGEFGEEIKSPKSISAKDDSKNALLPSSYTLRKESPEKSTIADSEDVPLADRPKPKPSLHIFEEDLILARNKLRAARAEDEFLGSLMNDSAENNAANVRDWLDFFEDYDDVASVMLPDFYDLLNNETEYSSIDNYETKTIEENIVNFGKSLDGSTKRNSNNRSHSNSVFGKYSSPLLELKEKTDIGSFMKVREGYSKYAGLMENFSSNMSYAKKGEENKIIKINRPNLEDDEMTYVDITGDRSINETWNDEEFDTQWNDDQPSMTSSENNDTANFSEDGLKIWRDSILDPNMSPDISKNSNDFDDYDYKFSDTEYDYHANESNDDTIEPSLYGINETPDSFAVELHEDRWNEDYLEDENIEENSNSKKITIREESASSTINPSRYSYHKELESEEGLLHQKSKLDRLKIPTNDLFIPRRYDDIKEAILTENESENLLKNSLSNWKRDMESNIDYQENIPVPTIEANFRVNSKLNDSINDTLFREEVNAGIRDIENTRDGAKPFIPKDEASSKSKVKRFKRPLSGDTPSRSRSETLSQKLANGKVIGEVPGSIYLGEISSKPSIKVSPRNSEDTINTAMPKYFKVPEVHQTINTSTSKNLLPDLHSLNTRQSVNGPHLSRSRQSSEDEFIDAGNNLPIPTVNRRAGFPIHGQFQHTSLHSNAEYGLNQFRRHLHPIMRSGNLNDDGYKYPTSNIQLSHNTNNYFHNFKTYSPDLLQVDYGPVVQHEIYHGLGEIPRSVNTGSGIRFLPDLRYAQTNSENYIINTAKQYKVADFASEVLADTAPSLLSLPGRMHGGAGHPIAWPAPVYPGIVPI